jgi:hypothetical protein
MNHTVSRTFSFENGRQTVRLPCLVNEQTVKTDVHLTDDERQLLEHFPCELIYGKVRVEQPKKFVPAMIFYEKKVVTNGKRVTIERYVHTPGTSIRWLL